MNPIHGSGVRARNRENHVIPFTSILRTGCKKRLVSIVCQENNQFIPASWAMLFKPIPDHMNSSSRCYFDIRCLSQIMWARFKKHTGRIQPWNLWNGIVYLRAAHCSDLTTHTECDVVFLEHRRSNSAHTDRLLNIYVGKIPDQPRFSSSSFLFHCCRLDFWTPISCVNPCVC